MREYFNQSLEKIKQISPDGIERLAWQLEENTSYRLSHKFSLKRFQAKGYFSVKPKDYEQTELLVGEIPPPGTQAAEFGYDVQDQWRRYGLIQVVPDESGRKIKQIYFPNTDLQDYFAEHLYGTVAK